MKKLTGKMLFTGKRRNAPFPHAHGIAVAFLLLFIIAFSAAAASPETGSVEDINPTHPEGWEQRGYPEDIVPLQKSRTLIKLKEEKTIEVPAVEKEVSAVAATGAVTMTAATGTAVVDEAAVAKAAAEAEAEAAAAAEREAVRQASLEEKVVKKKLNTGPFSGLVRLKYQTSSATGDEIGFLSQNGLLFFNDTIQQSTHINVDKKFDNGLIVEGRFIDEPYRDQHLNFNVMGRRGHAYVGDIQTGFRGGEMVAFSKRARGMDVDYDFGPVSMFAMMSQEKSRTERESFRGRNIRGPYSLRAASILEGSEYVTINGKPVQSVAYSLDYFLGQITFANNIDSSDLVEITYESVLQVSLNTGSLRGIGMYTDRKNKKYDMGVSYLEEGSSRIHEPIVFDNIMDDIENVVDGQTILLEHNYIKTHSEIIALNVSGVKNYLDRDSDYTIQYYDDDYYDDNNLKGKIKLADDLVSSTGSATGTLSIRYSYYNTKHLQRGLVEEFEIFEYDDAGYVLSYETIYPGPEVVFYVDDSRRTQLYPLNNGKEVNEYYEIDETNNIIIFHWDESIPDYSANPRIEISYETVPANSPGESDVKRTVWDMDGRVTIGDANVRAEYSETSSDVAMKTIQVVEERVATVVAATQLIYYLDFSAIRNTESVYFDDTVASKSRKRSGTDYVMEYDESGKAYLRFKNAIPLGTTIIASYKYNPGIATDTAKKGRAGRILADWNVYGGSLGLEYMLKSAYFSPLTSYSDEERERLGLNFKYAPGRNWAYEFSYRSHDDIASFKTGDFFTTRELGAKVKYRYMKGSYIEYTYERLTYRDSGPVRDTDIGRSRHRIDGTYSTTADNTVTGNFHIETRNMEDETGLTSDQGAMKFGVGVTYRPDETLSINLSTNSNTLDFDAPPIQDPDDPMKLDDSIGDFRTKTLSNVLDLTFLPVPMWTLNARVDVQEIQDERENTGTDSLHRIHTSVFSRPFGDFKKIYLGFDRQDRPNPYFGDSRTESANLKIAYGLSKNWTMSPGYTVTKSNIQDRSQNRNSNAGLLLDYRAGMKNGWLGSIQYSLNGRESSRLTSEETGWTDSDSSQTKISATARYIAMDRYEWNNSVSLTEGDSSLGKRGTVSSILDYRYSRNTRLNAQYNMEAITRKSGDRIRFQLGSTSELSENFTLGLSFKREKKMETGARPGYTGTLFNMTLDMKF